jgi:hypothetical protein
MDPVYPSDPFAHGETTSAGSTIGAGGSSGLGGLAGIGISKPPPAMAAGTNLQTTSAHVRGGRGTVVVGSATRTARGATWPTASRGACAKRAPCCATRAAVWCKMVQQIIDIAPASAATTKMVTSRVKVV